MSDRLFAAPAAVPAATSPQVSAAASAWRPYMPLLAALPLLPFANGIWSVPAAAGLAPALLLCFVRALPAVRGLPLAFAACYAAWCVQWHGVVRLPWPAYFVAGAVIAGVAFLPYVADRVLARRLRGVRATLVFPAALVAVEYLFAAAGPNGSWGAVAYTQYGHLPLLQVVALTGLWGLTFVVAWGASTIAHVLDAGRMRAERVRAAAVFGGALAAVLLYGGVRLALPHAGDTVLRVATLSPPYTANENYDPALAAAIQDDLYARSEREAQAGAAMILWPEDAFVVLPQDEAAMLARAAAFAREHGVWFGLAFGARVDDRTRRYANTSVMFTPAGQLAWRYLKAHPVAGFEEAYMVRGEAPPPVHAGPDGRYAAAICYDGDFPAFMRSIAPADLLILHADDWRAITPLHARMAVFRAIELGVPLVRPTINGTSIAVDHRGGVLATMNHFDSMDRAMVASVPIGGVATLYAHIGDAFAWAAIAGLAALAAMALRRGATAAASGR